MIHQKVLLIHSIRNKQEIVKNNAENISLKWIPSYRCFEGNEPADNLAKKGTQTAKT